MKVLPISSVTMNIPGRMNMAKKEIVFKAMLPALGFNTYYFQMKSLSPSKKEIQVTRDETCTLENEVTNQININRILFLSLVCASRI